MDQTLSPPLVSVRRLWKRPLVIILLGSVLIHILGGLIFGGIAIFRMTRPPEVEITVVPPPEAIQPREREYQLKTMRSQRNTALPTQVPITVDHPTDVPLPKLDVPRPDRGIAEVKPRGEAGSLGQGVGSGAGTGGFATLFGNTSPLAGALEGTFIDFKQNRNRRPQDGDGWDDAGRSFLRSFRMQEFRNFFQAPQKLYASHFYIPMLSADEAPRSFGVENQVEPSRWIAVYQGQFRSDVGGTFRFVGTADDILIAAVDRSVVLSGGFPQYNPTRWTPPEPPRHPGPRVSDYLPPLTYGSWFTLEPGKPRDLTIVIGEMPGGEFASYLFIQERGKDYPTVDGRPILPVFKLREFSRAEREQLAADGYPKDLDGPSFGHF